MAAPLENTFDQKIKCTIRDLYRCRGVEGFNDLIEEKLGFMVEEADWDPVRVESEYIIIRVFGGKFVPED